MRSGDMGRLCLLLALGLTMINLAAITQSSRAPPEPEDDGAEDEEGGLARLKALRQTVKTRKRQQRAAYNPAEEVFSRGDLDDQPEEKEGEEGEEEVEDDSKDKGKKKKEYGEGAKFVAKDDPLGLGARSHLLHGIHNPQFVQSRIMKESMMGAMVGNQLTNKLYESLSSNMANGAIARNSGTGKAADAVRRGGAQVGDGGLAAAVARMHQVKDLAQNAVPTGRKHQKQVECTKSGDVHVVYTANSNEYGAMLASAYSALRNSYNPNRLLFHFVTPHTADADELCAMIRVYSQAYPDVVCPVDEPLPREFKRVRECKYHMGDFEPGSSASPCMCGLQFHILQFNPASYPVMEHIRLSSKDRKELLSVMNFARNFIDDLLLPWGVERIIYMDADTIVQGDLRNLWLTKFKPGHFFAPAHTCNQPWNFWFNFKSWVIYNSLLKEDGCAVNVGVYLLDVKEYKANKVQKRIADLIAIHEKRLEGNMKGIWRRGVHQPSFVFSLYNFTQRVDSRWNLGQLGWDEHLDLGEVKDAHILHWNGQRKPWKSDGLYKQFWMPYALPLPAPQNAMLLGNCLVSSDHGD